MDCGVTRGSRQCGAGLDRAGADALHPIGVLFLSADTRLAGRTGSTQGAVGLRLLCHQLSRRRRGHSRTAADFLFPAGEIPSV